MAKQVGARQCGKQQVIHKCYCVNWTRIGKHTVPVPYAVQCTLSQSKVVSGDVFFNSNKAFTLSSDTNYVKGDAKGSKKGIKSNTVGAEAEPIEHSSSVRCNCHWVVRCGDLFHMNAKNTIGNLTCSPAVSKPHITDSGKIEGYSSPSSPASSVQEGSSTGMGASDSPGSLGSRMGSPVLLQHAQVWHHFAFMPLEGILPLALELHYVSRGGMQGAFGEDRACNYEKRFMAMAQNKYQLILPDGRWFVFERETANDTYQDKGNLGVSRIEQPEADTFVLYYRDGMIETYRYGLLVRIEDIQHPDNAIAISYLKHPIAGPRIAQITNTQQSSLSFDYNEEGYLQTLQDHTQAVWQFAYTDDGYLQHIHHNDTPIELYDYLSLEGADAPQLGTVYDANKQPRLVFGYDTQGRVQSYQQADTLYQYSYSPEGAITKEDNHGKRHTFWLNAHGEIRSILYPDGSFASQHYEEATRTLHETTRGGNSRETCFDEAGRILSEVFNDETTDHYSYEGANPSPLSHTSYDRQTQYRYDTHFRPVEIISPDKSTEQYSYTPEGAIASHTDASGAVTQFSYDQRARLIQVTDPLGAQTAYSHDNYGRVSALSDATGSVQHYRYDSRGALQSYRDGAGAQTEFAYSPTGQLTRITDPARRETFFFYDSYDRLESKCYPDGSKEQYSYHEDGTLSHILRADHTTLHFSYDDNANITTLTAIQEASDTQEALQESLHYRYDTLGNLLEASSDTDTLTLHYDAKAHITKEIQNNHTLRRYYTEAGEIERLQLIHTHIHYTHDPKGLLESIASHSIPNPIRLSHTPNGGVAQRVYPNGTKTDYHYDEASQLTQITHTLPTEQLETAYSRDGVGRVLQCQTEGKEALLYHYSPDGALESITEGEQTCSYSYNSAGNRTSTMLSNRTSTVLSTHTDKQEQIDKETRYAYNSANHLLESSTHLYRYDRRGNLIAKQDKATQESTTYTFNLFDQLIRVTHYDSTQQISTQYQYRYDALNRRTTKRFVHTQDPAQNYSHHYLYDNNAIIAILDHEQNLLSTLTHADSTDTPLSITNELTAETYYYHTDHQGSITHLTNSIGEIVETFAYDGTYGTILEHHKTEETYNPYCYTGREFDSKELYYYRARYYDPTIGRFISQDPIEFLAGDFNFYRYVGNDPVNWVDPSGLASALDFLSGKKQDTATKDIVSTATHIVPKATNAQEKAKSPKAKKNNKPEAPMSSPRTRVSIKGNKKKGECKPPKWMETAEKEEGTAEVPGKKLNNPKILEYHKASHYWEKTEYGAKGSWCGSFMAWVMKKNGFKPPKSAYRAASWREFGQKCTKPVYGAIGIKSRHGGNHVSFVVGRSADNKYLYMMGGNQGSPGKVFKKRYPRSVWDTFRVPRGYDCSKCGLAPIMSGKTEGGGD